MKKSSKGRVAGALCVWAAATCSAGGWGMMGAYWNTADASSGVGVGGKLSMEMVAGMQLELRATHFSDIASDRGGFRIGLEAIPVELGLAYHHPVMERLSAYGGIGIGIHSFSADVDSPAGPPIRGDTGNEIGYYLAGGAEWTLLDSGDLYGSTKAILFGELMYRVVEADNLVPVHGPEGVQFKSASLNGVGLNIGLMLRW